MDETPAPLARWDRNHPLLIEAPGVAMVLPSLIGHAGADAAEKTFEFFAARIANASTRAAYARAVQHVCDWCEEKRVPLRKITTPWWRRTSNTSARV